MATKPGAFSAEAKSTAPERRASRRRANRAAPMRGRPTNARGSTIVTRPHPY